jgi:exodeoxyribonuclease V beta subunit
MRGVRVARDGTRRSPICLFHLDIPGVEDQKLTASQARRRLARSIAQEIEYLLADPKAFQFVDPDTDKVRELLPSDLCVLVRRRATARGVEEELRTRGIPYTFYKKTGIYQSAEALHTSLLLGALADPDATHSLQPALLSRFFGRTPRELAQNPAEVEQATRHHFVRWRELCRERRWAQLFAGLLEDTGLACREALEADGDRRLANFRQLFHDLVVLAESESLDVAGLREQLDLRRRRSVSVDGEADLHHLDTEKPKVTLMTMHASKGLQFPIVFIADGFSELGRVDGSMIHYHQDGQRVTELKTSQGFAGKATASQESEEETRRLFYVALTRARFKVYIPFGWNPGKDEPKPLTPLLTPAFEPFWDCGDDMQNNEMVCHLTYKGEITGTGYPMPPVDTIRELIPASLPAPVGADEVLQVVEGLIPVPSLRRWQRQVDSYSSLAQDHERAPRMSFGEGGHEEEGDDWSAPALEQTLVPPGAAAGTALHEILEQVDFATLGECRNPENLLGEHPALAEIVARCMTRNGLANQIRGQQSTQLELARMAWRAVTTPLGPDGFCLAQVPASDRQSELEFHLSEGEDWLGWSAAVPSDRRGLLNGFVDLVYRWQGQYYIVDWKSNALPGGYARGDVMASMEEHEYTLQYRIYALALAAWLRTCLPNFSPDLHLGGVYYLYVRGLNGVDATEGVFYQRLGEEQLAEYRQDVLDRLAAHS